MHSLLGRNNNIIDISTESTLSLFLYMHLYLFYSTKERAIKFYVAANDSI